MTKVLIKRGDLKKGGHREGIEDPPLKIACTLNANFFHKSWAIRECEILSPCIYAIIRSHGKNYQ